jgi:hypothetical protein
MEWENRAALAVPMGGSAVNASALVVGPRDGASAAISELAKALGFAPVERYAGLARTETQALATPLIFFLCAAVSDVATLEPMARTIRFAAGRLRFSPLVYFTHAPSVDTIRQCIRMGFDDVIALPSVTGAIGERLFRQIGQPHVYYETATYFGPDRRNRLGQDRSTDSDHGGGQYRRIEIVRDPRSGVNVLRDDFEVVV